MPKERILVIDDEADICELIRYNLTRDGFDVVCAGSGEEALEQLKLSIPDLAILDIMLPGMSGIDVCKYIKSDSKYQSLPVVMLSAKGEEADVVTGLELGADDYLVKPFSPRILLARIRAVLRRHTNGADFEPEPTDTLRVEELSITPGKHELLIHGHQVDLTATEFRILHLLAAKRGWVFTRNQIIHSVHGTDYPVTDRSVDVQITGLRKKLGEFGDYLETVRGVGYRFKE